MSEDLECRVVPRVNEDSDPSVLAQYAANGIPLLAPRHCSRRVTEACVGGDGLEFLTGNDWNTFSQPKVAMVSGWGRPGTPVDAVNDRDLALVSSFEEVLSDPRVLNLQMFHRKQDAYQERKLLILCFQQGRLMHPQD